MKNTLLVCVLSCVTLSACSSASSISQLSNTYSAVRAGMGAKSAYTSVKDLKDAEPVFSGYSYVAALAQVTPRTASPALPEAFRQDLLYLVDASAQAVKAPISSCPYVQCSGRTLLVQFREDGYNGNILERIGMGDRLKGVLTYSDQATGQIIATKHIEGVDTYENLLGLIKASIATSMIKSFPGSNSDSTQQSINAIGNIATIKPGYEQAFKGS